MESPDYLFETKRLRIRHWKDTDVEDAFVIYGDPIVQRTLRDDGKTVRDLTEMAHILGEKIESRSDWVMGRGNWAIVHKALGHVIGGVSFDRIPTDSEDIGPEIEVTWALGKQFWGFGYATEAARGAIEYGCTSNPAVVRVIARCRPSHRASRSVAERLGMKNLGLTTRFGGATLAIYELASSAISIIV
jgi:ribosomal-protein-alanine N-acetyltransferase